METGLSLFKSRVAKRVFFLFLVSAMLPITVFSLLSFFQVSDQLKRQSMERIQSTSKSYGLILFERFRFLDMELDVFTSSPADSRNGNHSIKPEAFSSLDRENLLKSATFIPDSAKRFEPPETMGKFSFSMDTLRKGLQGGKTRVLFDTDGRVFLVKRDRDILKNPGVIVGTADSARLWGVGYDNILPPQTEICILDHNRNILFSSFQLPPDIQRRIRFGNDGVETRSLEYTDGGQGYIAGYWPLFLKSKFDGPNLIVVLRNNKDDVFAPLSYFKVLFPLVALLAFWVVLLFSVISIRKSLVPLEKLKEGARRLARRDFETRVEVKSGDEFEVLADLFNTSAARLGRHFKAMETMAEIDRAVHASLDTNAIVMTAMKHTQALYATDMTGFGIIHPKKKDSLRMFTCTEPHCDTFDEDFLTLSRNDRELLLRTTDALVLETTPPGPTYLPPHIAATVKSLMVLPLFHHKVLSGIICFGQRNPHTFTDDDLAHGKRLANQLSSALSNALLVEELENLNWGTLEALARTVDAKSRWTAGHSERVADMALKIARVMGCDDQAIDTLHRAAFLHDIGKIGIPMAILDKPDKLTEAEYSHVKEHPAIGAKIIEPIESYEAVIPLILQHHERYDGTGYPMGLSGDDICLGARILAVADVYDAIISNRPYRQGWVADKVVQLIRDESGRHFDPRVVEAFLNVDMAR